MSHPFRNLNDDLLNPRNIQKLVDYCDRHNWRPSYLLLEQERERRGFRDLSNPAPLRQTRRNRGNAA